MPASDSDHASTPSIATARVVLTPLTLDDAPAVFAYRSDPEVSRYQFFEPRSLDDARDFIAGAEELGWLQLGIRVERGSVLAGHVALRLSGDPPVQAEIGVSLAREHQGRGYATEALLALLEHLFAEAGVHRVFASIDPRNVASLALFARLGMRQEAHHRRSVWFKGEWADDVVVALLQSEWQARRAASPKVEVRPYSDSDRTAVLELTRRFSEFPVPEWRRREHIDAANYQAISSSLELPAEGEAFFTAQRNGVFAGFVHVQTRRDHFSGEPVAYVADLAVHPSSEGAGVATRLLDQALVWARGRGLRLLTLDVFHGNERARRLYERHGFCQDTVQYTRKVDS